MAHWMFHWMGLDDASGAAYLWWSGFCADLVFLGALGTFYKHIQCHAQGCKRPAFHPVHGTSFKVCKRHHPTGGNSLEQIHQAHASQTKKR